MKAEVVVLGFLLLSVTLWTKQFLSPTTVRSGSEVKASFRVVYPLPCYLGASGQAGAGREEKAFCLCIYLCVCMFVYVPVEFKGQCQVLSIFHKCSPPYVVCLV